MTLIFADMVLVTNSGLSLDLKDREAYQLTQLLRNRATWLSLFSRNLGTSRRIKL